MPEGPEIRRAALRIDKVLSGRQAEIVSFGQAHLQRFGQHLSGCLLYTSDAADD